MMDEGQIDASIALLREGEQLDPKNYLFPYEIAYAHFLKQEYKKAIKILNKIKKYKPTSSQVFQMSGNCYSYLGEPDKAIKEYNSGLKHFPNAGNLYLERGNIYLHQEIYDEVVKDYRKGIEVDPEFSSNYFRLAKLFLDSNDKLSGIIYGEIFMNLERSSARTQEMSELLFITYQSSVIFREEELEIDFCDIMLDESDFLENDEIKMPFCASFGNNFILAVIDEEQIDLTSLARIRKKFLQNHFKKDYLEYPNVLFEYQKVLLDNNLFDAYNHYLFQVGAHDEYEVWLEANEEEYERFTKRFTKRELY